jgi:S-adenosylmethionine:tRNA ribosyltransferase-isomerase
VVKRLAEYIEPGTLMVFNDSRVRKARLFANALDSGAQVEFLLLSRLDEASWETTCTKMKKQVRGRRYDFGHGVIGEIADSALAETGTRQIRFVPPIGEDWLDRHGHIPLPPYIRRSDAPDDAERYQTIFAQTVGSSASPTAGLHFTEELLAAIRVRGIETTAVTLHVGLGTFMPVRSEEIEDHHMHEEAWIISGETAAMVRKAKAEGRPVMAVGTTSVRSLESAWKQGDSSHDAGIRAGEGRTRIFIKPGYQWKVVDKVFTNFHTPKSTLLMLVAAFAGRQRILEAYAEAIAQGYRFFSYGDAMLIQ